MPDRPAKTTVHVNGKWLSHELSGTERYASEIVTRLVVRADHDYVLHLPKGTTRPQWAEHLRVRRSKLGGQLFEQIALPLATIGEPLISIAGPAPLLKRRQIVAMHDATPFALGTTYRWAFRTWYRTMYRVLGRTAAVIVTVSEFSAGELSMALHVGRDRFHVVPNGAEHLAAARSRPVDRSDEPFVLLVGGNIPHKNTQWAVDALQDLGVRVVVVGKTQPSRQFSGMQAPRSGADWVGRVSDAELRDLYTDALCLVFPSLYEGFGIPLLEAQALDCPVVCSTEASMPEVAGEGALYFDTNEPDTLRGAVTRLLDDADERRRLVEFGKKNLKRFSWHDSAARFSALLDAL